MRHLLENTKIIDLTRALAGPYCTALLADLGADVIKIETGPGGDGARAWPPFDAHHDSLYFAPINRNKRSLNLDLRSPAGMEVLHTLLAEADVLVENYRPGTLERMGLDPDLLRQRYPRLVITSISGLGHVGPERHTAGLDQIAQGMSGLMSVTGTSADDPVRVGIPVIDTVAGMFAALGTAAALASRAQTGTGSHVQGSLLESALSIMNFQAQRYLSNGEVPEPTGNNHPTITPYGAYATADERINIAVGTDAQWRKLSELLGDPSLPDQDRYREASIRLQHREELTDDLEKLLATRTAAEWIPLIRAAGIPCGPIHTMDHVFEDPQVQALQMIRHTTGVHGEMPLLRGPLWVDGEASEVYRHPPALGEHSVEILAEAGLDTARIEELVADEIICDGRTTHRSVTHA